MSLSRRQTAADGHAIDALMPPSRSAVFPMRCRVLLAAPCAMPHHAYAVMSPFSLAARPAVAADCVSFTVTQFIMKEEIFFEIA